MWFLHWGYLCKMLPRGPQCSQAACCCHSDRAPESTPSGGSYIYYIRLLCVCLVLLRGLQRLELKASLYPCQWNKACWCQRFFLCPPRWEDLCALSHAAVKDSCHPVSGSNTQSMRKGLWAEGTREISGNLPPPSSLPTRTSRREQNKPRKERGRSREFWWIRIFKYSDTRWGYLEKRRKKQRTNTKAIFLCASRGKSGLFRTDMKTKKGRLDSWKSNQVDISVYKQRQRTETSNRAISLICKPCSLLFPFQTWQGAFSAMCWRDVTSQIS